MVFGGVYVKPKVKKDRAQHEREASQILKIIHNLRFFHNYSKKEVCDILEIDVRMIVYWENGEYGRGIKDFDLYPRVIRNCIRIYSYKKPFSEKEIKFVESLNRINVRLNS